jgi:hypothetical protein
MAGIGGAAAPPHESHPCRGPPRTWGRGEERSGQPRRAPRAAGATPAAGARVEEEAPHGEAEEMGRRAGRGEEARRRRCGGVRGEERRRGREDAGGGEGDAATRREEEARQRGAGRGGEARRAVWRWGCEEGRRGVAVPAVSCQGRVMGQAGSPWPARPFVPCRHEHAVGRAVPPMGRAKRPCRGPCHRPMGRLYTYTLSVGYTKFLPLRALLFMRGQLQFALKFCKASLDSV